MPIQAGSITRMSSDKSRARPSGGLGELPDKPTSQGRVTVRPSGPGRVTSWSGTVNASPVAGLSASTDHASVPDGPVCGSPWLNMASITGVGTLESLPGSALSWSQRQRITAAVAATTPGKSRRWPQGGNGISNECSSATVAKASSLSCSQAGSLARKSIDSVLARAPKPRGCSAPLTQTSNGLAAPPSAGGSSPPNRAKSPNGGCTMHVHAGLPAGSSGRPGQRKDDNTGAGRRSSAKRWLAPSICKEVADPASAVTLSTDPNTEFGR